jgi:hypothetical protein
MWRPTRRFTAPAAVLTIALAGAALGPAGAATNPVPDVPPPAHSIFSAEQAAYAVLGSQFRHETATFTLPKTAILAPFIGSFSLSVQLWSVRNVFVVDLSTCTTVFPCATGRAPASEPYFVSVTIYNPATRARVRKFVTLVPGMKPGDSVTETLYYNRSAGSIRTTVADPTADLFLRFRYPIGTGISYDQGRVGLETSEKSPWGPPAFTYNAVGASKRVVAIARVYFTDYKGQRGTVSSALWHHVPVTWTRNGRATGAVNGFVGRLSRTGSAFGAFLAP